MPIMITGSNGVKWMNSIDPGRLPGTLQEFLES